MKIKTSSLRGKQLNHNCEKVTKIKSPTPKNTRHWQHRILISGGKMVWIPLGGGVRVCLGTQSVIEVNFLERRGGGTIFIFANSSVGWGTRHLCHCSTTRFYTQREILPITLHCDDRIRIKKLAQKSTKKPNCGFSHTDGI